MNTGTKFCFYFFTLTSEGKLELEKCNKSFTLLPREFVGTLVDKFLNGALANKAWPHGALTVGEVAAEYSYLGGRPLLGAANIRVLFSITGSNAK